MALPGEVGHIGSTCEDCGTKLEAQVLHSGAGYYIGTQCQCGPYSRESAYYLTREEAQHHLDTGDFGRSTEYGGKAH